MDNWIIFVPFNVYILQYNNLYGLMLDITYLPHKHS
jgi:hypothetical protein